jgi:hypothetical protein
METNSLVAVRRAIEELRTVEQSLMLNTGKTGTHNIPTNEVLQKHRDDTKSWKVTSQSPTVVASFAFEQPDTKPTYPHIQTLNQDDSTLVDFFEEITAYLKAHADAGEQLTYMDIRYCHKGVTLDVVDRDKEEAVPESHEETDTSPWEDEPE